MLTDLVSGESPLPGLWKAVFFSSDGEGEQGILGNSSCKDTRPSLQKQSHCRIGLQHLNFGGHSLVYSCCFGTQSCLTRRDPMGCSTPGFPLLHHLPEFAQTHVHWVDDAIQPSHPLLPSFSCPQYFPVSWLFASGHQTIVNSVINKIIIEFSFQIIHCWCIKKEWIFEYWSCTLKTCHICLLVLIVVCGVCVCVL